MRIVMMLLWTIPMWAQIDIKLLGEIPLSQMSLNPVGASDIWGFKDGNGREYAGIGVQNGTVFFDLNDPSQPREIGAVPALSSIWRDLKTYTYDASPESFRAYAFVTCESAQGIQIIDLSNVPTSVRNVGTFDGIMTAHNIFIHPNSDKTFAYVLGSNLGLGGVDVLDISDPESPQIAGAWHERYTHDFFLNNVWADSKYNGKDIGIAFCGQAGISIIDFEDKSAPKTLASATYPSLAYSHSGWTTDDGRYLYAFDEIDELSGVASTRAMVFDLIDIENPQLVATWNGPTAATDHNGFVRGNYIHLSNYNRGYTIIDITNPLLPFHAGNYDTFAANDNPGFNGIWGCFPYYQSNIVAMSDIQRGLLIFKPATEFSFEVVADRSGVATCLNTESATIQISTSVFGPFNGDFRLDVAELPLGISAINSNSQFDASQSAAISFLADETTQPDVYQIQLLITASSGEVQQLPVEVEIVDGSDKMFQELSPSNGQIDQIGSPLSLSWDDQGYDRSYRVQVSRDEAFSDIVHTEVTNLAHASVALDDQTYYWQVTVTNPCGIETTSAVQAFTTGQPRILLVDDDDNNPDVRSFYTDWLNQAKLPFDVFDVGGADGNGPDEAKLMEHHWVLWFSGDQFRTNTPGDEAGPNQSDEDSLSNFLDSGRHLLLSSQDYVRDRGSAADEFLAKLGVASVSPDIDAFTQVQTSGTLTPLGDLNLSAVEGQSFPDALTAGTGVSAMSTASADTVAVETSQSLFASFRLEALFQTSNLKADDLLFSTFTRTRPYNLIRHEYQLYFPLNGLRVMDQASIVLINRSQQGVTAHVVAVSDDGVEVAEAHPYIQPNAKTSWDLNNLTIDPKRVLWIHVTSDSPLLGYLDAREPNRAFATPGVSELSTELIVPHIARDTEQFFTQASIINGSSETIASQYRDLGGNSVSSDLSNPLSGFLIDFADEFNGITEEQSALTYFTSPTTPALAGVEIFGYQDGKRIAGLTLTGEQSQTLYFAHLAVVENGWWTGIAVTYPGNQTANLSITAFDEQGLAIATSELSLLAGQKLLALRDQTHAMEALFGSALSSDAVWLKIECDQPITGYEIFGDHSGRQFAGFQASILPQADQVFPFAGDSEHWSGLAIINPSSTAQQVTLEYVSNQGEVLEQQSLELVANGKLLTLSEDLFASSVTSGYVTVSSGGQGIIAFQLYGPRDFSWLNGLNGL